jgi:hypothetical protein
VRLVSEAGRIFRRAWSVRLSLLAAILTAIYAAWDYHVSGHTSVVVLMTFFLNISAAVARIVDQPKLRDGVRSRKTDRRK